ncbi:hypothetical protein NFA_49710 [Nocardia farcinica IFM 10152]|uniref:Uncharacterized protein n=1 Tax=Nocardia farcinica (strain IFM 10152) TaxID=247156 RepID=Q5YPR8_NOCFA|nr:hypothetical protein NFA_49710 [Nocardia farcinica IFM 10152]
MRGSGVGPPGPPHSSVQPSSLARSVSTAASRKYLLLPRSAMVLIFSSANTLSCASVKPASAEGGADRISASGLFSYALSRALSSTTLTAMRTP